MRYVIILLGLLNVSCAQTICSDKAFDQLKDFVKTKVGTRSTPIMDIDLQYLTCDPEHARAVSMIKITQRFPCGLTLVGRAMHMWSFDIKNRNWDIYDVFFSPNIEKEIDAEAYKKCQQQTD